MVAYTELLGNEPFDYVTLELYIYYPAFPFLCGNITEYPKFGRYVCYLRLKTRYSWIVSLFAEVAEVGCF